MPPLSTVLVWGWDMRPPDCLGTWFSCPEGTLSPAAAMYVLPMVLIFSTPLNLGFNSSYKTKGSRPYNTAAAQACPRF